jgi:predicted N-acyltransferase
METGSRKWGRPYLTRQFYSLIGETMRDRVLLVMAKRNGRYIGGAINFIGSDTLYGRHWGAIEHHPFLHFELCYYQAIDFAIQKKLKRVEAGAQGEHKLARRLHAGDDLLGALHRRSGAAPRDCGLPQARARLCGSRGQRARRHGPFRKDLVFEDTE